MPGKHRPWTACAQCHRWTYNYKLNRQPVCFCGEPFPVPGWWQHQGRSAAERSSDRRSRDRDTEDTPYAKILELAGTLDPSLVAKVQAVLPQTPEKPSKVSARYSEATTKVAAALRGREKATDKVLALSTQLEKAEEELAKSIVQYEEAVVKEQELQRDLETKPAVPTTEAADGFIARIALPTHNKDQTLTDAINAYNKRVEVTNSSISEMHKEAQQLATQLKTYKDALESGPPLAKRRLEEVGGVEAAAAEVATAMAVEGVTSGTPPTQGVAGDTGPEPQDKTQRVLAKAKARAEEIKTQQKTAAQETPPAPSDTPTGASLG